MLFTLTDELALRPEPFREREQRPQVRVARHQLIQHPQAVLAEAPGKARPRQPQGLTDAVYAKPREPLQDLWRPAQRGQRQRTDRAHQQLLFQHLEGHPTASGDEGCQGRRCQRQHHRCAGGRTARTKCAIQPCHPAKQGEAAQHFQHQPIRRLETHPGREPLGQDPQALQQRRIRLRQMHPEP